MEKKIIKVRRETDNTEIKINLNNSKDAKTLEKFCKKTNGFISFILNQK